MRRILPAIALTTAVAIVQPAAGASRVATWEASDCDEVTLVTPANPAAPDMSVGTTALIIVVYQCEQGKVGNSIVGPFAVSEIGAVTPTAIVLLRQVSSSPELVTALRRLGVPAYHGKITLDVVEAPAGLATATVETGAGRFSVTAAAAPDPPGTPSSFFNGPGASYRTSGRKGTVMVSYQNRFDGSDEGPGAAAGTVDATNDPALTRWMGTSRSAGPGVYIRGYWTGTAAPAGS
ncbi:MAG TPA: hypothetical protein VHL78_11100 [Actinomycetota bacterium]|nr:hypothetical protein [Actinomycetota bacterium]